MVSVCPICSRISPCQNNHLKCSIDGKEWLTDRDHLQINLLPKTEQPEPVLLTDIKTNITRKAYVVRNNSGHYELYETNPNYSLLAASEINTKPRPQACSSPATKRKIVA